MPLAPSPARPPPERVSPLGYVALLVIVMGLLDLCFDLTSLILVALNLQPAHRNIASLVVVVLPCFLGVAATASRNVDALCDAVISKTVGAASSETVKEDAPVKIGKASVVEETSPDSPSPSADAATSLLGASLEPQPEEVHPSTAAAASSNHGFQLNRTEDPITSVREKATEGSPESFTRAEGTSESRLKARLTPAQFAAATALSAKLSAVYKEADVHPSMRPTVANAYRYLRARNYDTVKAENLWRSAIEWRQSYRLTERRARIAALDAQGPGFDARHDFLRKHWMQWAGTTDRYGHPLLIFRAGTSDPSGLVRELGTGTDVFIEYYMDVVEQVLERVAELDQLDIGILELNDLRVVPEVSHFFSRASSAVPHLLPVARILDEVYAERLRTCFVAGVPSVFFAVWKLVLPFIPAETKKKISIFRDGDMETFMKRLRQEVPAENLPVYLGGDRPNANVLLGGAVSKGSFANFHKTQGPYFTIGMIADVQHCDADNGTNFKQTMTRRYRGALNKGLVTAVNDWLRHDVSIAVQLGDIIDGAAKAVGDTEKALSRVRAELERFATAEFNPGHIPPLHESLPPGLVRRVLHVVGNHELYNGPRATIAKGLNAGFLDPGSDLQNFGGPRSFSPHPSYRFLVMDAYERNVIDTSNPSYAESVELLVKNNPNDFRVSKDWLAGLHGTRRRFVPYNGGVSPAQLKWLSRELDQAVNHENQFVLVFVHVAVMPGSTAASCLLWNYQDVLGALAPFATSSFGGKKGVVAVFSGHDHNGGYAVGANGIHYFTLASPLESGEDCLGHCTVAAGPTGLLIRGPGQKVYQDQLQLPAYTNKQEALEAHKKWADSEVQALFNKCAKEGIAKSLTECRTMFESFENSWDELPPGWPRKTDS